MSEDADGRQERQIYWAGRQWCVSDFGLETIKPHHYAVPAENLGDLSHGIVPSAERLRHVAQKTWVDVEDLIAAFSVAVLVHTGKFEPLPPEALINALTNIRASRWRTQAYDQIKSERGLSGGPVSHTQSQQISAAVEPLFVDRLEAGPAFKFIPDPG